MQEEEPCPGIDEDALQNMTPTTSLLGLSSDSLPLVRLLHPENVHFKVKEPISNRSTGCCDLKVESNEWQLKWLALHGMLPTISRYILYVDSYYTSLRGLRMPRVTRSVRYVAPSRKATGHWLRWAT